MFTANVVLAAVTDADKRKMLSRYESAMARGKQADAVEYLLDYTEKSLGENDPATVKLMHRLGQVLYESGEYRKATKVLKEALERTTTAFGKSGGEAYEISMNIGYAYSRWSPSLTNRTEYFDRALEILRERGQYPSIEYVTTLINIAVNLMSGDGLKGDYTANAGDYFDSFDRDDGSDYFASIGQEYSNYFQLAERYVLEAVEVGRQLETEDEYISAKIAILQAKLKVMETADLAAVPMGVSGYISAGTARENYAREDVRLVSAIDKLAEDTDANKIFLETANKIRLEIAWLGKDGTRLAAMCADGGLNSASGYPPERIYEVTEDGVVIAPDVSMGISRKLLNPIRIKRNSKGERIKRPHFVPVCIDGQLMAALTHVPRVTIEEVRRPAKRPRSGRR
ncbi:MAG: tetratricopeptide repeat protein [Xanthomonadales bacterium]|nr:tetratricopeptide repeat protein [Xanthomonadales bacterium]